MTDPVDNPAEALKVIGESRAQVADQMAKGTWGYDLVYAALVGLMVGGQGLPRPFGIVATIVCVVALMLLLRTWTNRTGVLVTGFTPPKARWVAIGLGVLMGALMLAVALLTRTTGLWQIPVAAGVLGSVIAFAGSRLWWTVYRAESEAGRQ